MADKWTTWDNISRWEHDYLMSWDFKEYKNEGYDILLGAWIPARLIYPKDSSNIGGHLGFGMFLRLDFRGLLVC